MRFAADYIEGIFTRVATLSKTDLLAQHAQRSIIDALDRYFPALHQAFEMLLVNLGKQHVILPAPLPIDAVIRAHDRSHAFIYCALEMAQIDLVERARFDGHIYAVTGIFHRIQRVMLGAGHHVLLDAAHQGSPKLTQVNGIFAVGFLRTPPSRVTQQVDAYAAKEI